MELNLTTATGKASTKKLEVSDANFAAEFNEPLVHQAVVAYLAGARAGTRAHKNRSAVRGGGKKPWRQKGTGRGPGPAPSAARCGAAAARPSRPRRRITARSSTRRCTGRRSARSCPSWCARITAELSEPLYLSARNIPNIGICDVTAIDPVSLVGYDKIVMTVDAVKKIEESLA